MWYRVVTLDGAASLTAGSRGFFYPGIAMSCCMPTLWQCTYMYILVDQQCVNVVVSPALHSVWHCYSSAQPSSPLHAGSWLQAALLARSCCTPVWTRAPHHATFRHCHVQDRQLRAWPGRLTAGETHACTVIWFYFVLYLISYAAVRTKIKRTNIFQQ